MIQASISTNLWAANSALAKVILAGLLQRASLHQEAQSSALPRMRPYTARSSSLQPGKHYALLSPPESAVPSQRAARRAEACGVKGSRSGSFFKSWAPSLSCCSLMVGRSLPAGLPRHVSAHSQRQRGEEALYAQLLSRGMWRGQEIDRIGKLAGS